MENGLEEDHDWEAKLQEFYSAVRKADPPPLTQEQLRLESQEILRIAKNRGLID